MTYLTCKFEGREVEVVCRYRKGRIPYFSSNFGNWLPGDPPELELQKVYDGETDILPSLTLLQIERLEELVIMKIAEESR